MEYFERNLIDNILESEVNGNAINYFSGGCFLCVNHADADISSGVCSGYKVFFLCTEGGTGGAYSQRKRTVLWSQSHGLDPYDIQHGNDIGCRSCLNLGWF